MDSQGAVVVGLLSSILHSVQGPAHEMVPLTLRVGRPTFIAQLGKRLVDLPQDNVIYIILY